jgi:Tol biopolymer transport system component
MTADQRIERDLPFILDEIVMGPHPDYIDDVLSTTAHGRQRPGWTFPERWLPVELTTARVPQTPLPWRQLIVLALLIALLAAAGAIYVGSHQTVLPQPFGPARNGLVAYAKAGDIYTVDPKTDLSKAIVSGKDQDSMATFSRDGTRLAFVRLSGAGYSVYLTDVDGRDPHALSHPQVAVKDLAFSPDGSSVMFTVGPDDQRELWVANTIGQPDPRRIDVGMNVSDPAFAPPDGAEIMFAGGAAASPAGNGLYAVQVDGGKLRTIMAPVPGTGRGWVRPSPDGTRIAYSADSRAPDRNTFRVHVVGADGTGDIALPLPNGATFEDAPEWSNDGTSLAVTRGYGLHNEAMVLAVVPADGSTPGHETDRGLTGCCDTTMLWSPDDTEILVGPEDRNGNPTTQLLWNPVTQSTSPAPWGADGNPAWQRR